MYARCDGWFCPAALSPVHGRVSLASAAGVAREAVAAVVVTAAAPISRARREGSDTALGRVSALRVEEGLWDRVTSIVLLFRRGEVRART